MHEWLSGRASPCQGEGREFESRLVLIKSLDFQGIFYCTDMCRVCALPSIDKQNYVIWQIVVDVDYRGKKVANLLVNRYYVKKIKHNCLDIIENN